MTANPRELAAALREKIRTSYWPISLAVDKADELAAALEKGADAIDALEALEWAGYDEMEAPLCPACDSPAAFEKHKRDCFLAAALGSNQ